jgi:hypothetical protein
MVLRKQLQILLACGLCVAFPRAASAQVPLPTGTAAGLGAAAMTEARLAEAALWNPALGGIFDGPISSVSLLGFAIDPGQPGMSESFARMGYKVHRQQVFTLDQSIRDAFASWAGTSSAARFRADASIHWLGIHSRDMLLSLSSHLYEHAALPAHAARIISRDEGALFESATPEVTQLAAGLPSRRAASTVLAVAKAHDLGLLPVFGRAWVGATAKGALIHDHSAGFSSIAPAAALLGTEFPQHLATSRLQAEEQAVLYRELGVENGRIYSFDVGMVAHPWRPILLSATLANIYQRASLEHGTAYERTLLFAGADGAGNTRVHRRTIALDELEDAESVRRAAEVARRTHFAPAIRAGASLDLELGRLLVGGSLPLESEESIDRHAHDHYSVAFQAHGPTNTRISYSKRHDTSSKVAFATSWGTCQSRLTVEVGYLQLQDAKSGFTVGGSWAKGNAPCGLFR